MADYWSPWPGRPESIEWWRPIADAPGYQVSDLGRVRSVDRTCVDGRKASGRVLFQEIAKNGYPMVVICPNGKRRRVAVHRLVVAAFIKPVPPGREVRHLNGVKTDNRAANLRIGTRLQNTRDRQRHGNAARKLTAPKVRQMRNRYAAGGVTFKQLGAEYGVSGTSARLAVIGQTWTHIRTGKTGGTGRNERTNGNGDRGINRNTESIGSRVGTVVDSRPGRSGA